MKRIFTLCILLCAFATGFSQKDTTGKSKPDTIRIGGMVIIRENGPNPTDTLKKKDRSFTFRRRNNNEKPANISTNWWILDLGFSNWVDNTNYAAAQADNFTGAGVGEDQFQLRAGKSRSVNVWIFMQRLNMIKHVVNLKYGLGLELNNYHFDDTRTRFTKSPTQVLLDPDYANLKKNKLAADYLTVPIMLNFNFTPNHSKGGFGLSAGVSAGYLYSARQKTKEDGDVNKTKSDFDLERFKLSYVGELSLGPIRLYGSYAFKNMFEKGLDLTPYSFGIRFSNW